MKNITRRDFIKGLAGTVALSTVPSIVHAIEEQEKNRAQVEGTKEYKLRKEIRDEMKKTSTSVGYFTGSGRLSVKQDLNHENIMHCYHLTVKNLLKIRNQLQYSNFYKGNKGPNIESMHE